MIALYDTDGSVLDLKMDTYWSVQSWTGDHGPA